MRTIFDWWQDYKGRDTWFAMHPDKTCRCNKDDYRPLHGDRHLGTFHSGYGNSTYKAIYYTIDNYSNDIIDNKLTNVVTGRAIGKWNARIKKPIFRVYPSVNTGSGGYNDGKHGFGPLITIKFVSGSDMVNPGALAEAQRGRMRINDDWEWGVDFMDVDRNLGFTICHEFGHVLRYLHSNCHRCVMNPTYQDIMAILQEHEVHDAIMDYGANPKWDSVVYRRNLQNLWERNLNDWWKDFVKRNR